MSCAGVLDTNALTGCHTFSYESVIVKDSLFPIESNFGFKEDYYVN